MKPNVIREMSTSELNERLVEEKKHLQKLKLNHSVSPLENPLKIQLYRKTIARIKTELHARDIEQSKSKV